MSVSELPPIAAVGASAGGLDALERFFTEIPKDSGFAFVVVQHLSPDFKSVMDDLLARRTSIPIHQASEGLEIEPNTIYLTPPKTELRLAAGRFHLEPPATNRQVPLPIDVFLRSLAKQAGDQRYAIILSGTGSDGSKGAAELKKSGGRVYAQSAESAKFDGMPRAVIATGAVDFVGSPKEIAELLATGQVAPHLIGAEDDDLSDEERALSELFDIMRKVSGVDFTLYKPSTVMRRLERRRQLVNADTIPDYVRLVRERAGERESLLRDLLIEVTVFFRDPEAFEALRTTVVPALLESQPDSLRVWVPGCATGEEAYSWAILLREACEHLPNPPALKIFATDVHRGSLEFASLGRYGPDAVRNLDADLLSKYFDEREGTFHVVPELRAHVVFAEHNLLKDPPFTRVDVVSCRNVLIYLETEAQEDVLGRFHFALQPGGVLFLGPSESLGKLDGEFSTEERHWRIFRKNLEGTLTTGLPHPSLSPAPLQRRGQLGAKPIAATTIPLRRGFYDRLLERFIPAGFLVDERGSLLHTFGDAGRFLHVAGPASSDLASMLPGDLRVAVGTAMKRALRAQEPVTYSGVELAAPDGKATVVSVTAAPLFDSRSNDSALFVQISEPVAASEPEPVASPEKFEASELAQRRVQDLEQQLQEARENLQVTIEELETSNEELQATNEELLASNEELQSTNEELQSVNEELYTVNAEYEKRNEELLETNRDLSNLMDSTDIGTIFLDRDLNIRKFTPAIVGAFRLKEQDIGRPLEDITSLFESGRELLVQSQRVLETGEAIEEEVTTRTGQHFLQRITPYRGERNTLEGIVITYVDLSMEWDIRRDMQHAQALQRAVLESLSANVAVLNRDGEIIGINTSWEDFARDNGASSLEAVGVGSNYFAACVGAASGQDRTDAQRALAGIRDVLLGRRSGFEMQYPCNSPSERRWYQMNVTPLDRPDGGAVVMHLDVTDVKEARRELEHVLDAVSSADIAFFLTDRDGTFQHVNEAFSRMTGYSDVELLGQHTRMLKTGNHALEYYRGFWDTIVDGRTWSGHFVNRRKDGTEYVSETTVAPISNGAGVTSFMAFARDVTETHRLNEQMRRMQRLETVGQLAGGVAHDFNNLLTPIIGYSEMLLEDTSDGHRDLVEPVLEAATKAQDLTRQLLAFSRQQPVETKVFDLNEQVVAFRKMLRRLLREDIEIEYKLRGAPLTVQADPQQLDQVLLNIAVNAQDAMPDGGHLTIATTHVHLEASDIALYPALEQGEYALLSMSDTGHGIKPSVVERLFEPFFTTKAPGKGTGLGLATAYGIVRRHRGAILVKSEEGQGASFTVCLPISQAEASAARTARDEPRPEPGHGEHVVVVEDDPGVRKLAVRIIKSGGYEVTAFENPREALSEIKRMADGEGPLDIVLSDVIMPEMNGPELAVALRKARVEAPVLFMSGYTGETLRAEGADTREFLAKPFTRASLLTYLRRALDRAEFSRLATGSIPTTL